MKKKQLYEKIEDINNKIDEKDNTIKALTSMLINKNRVSRSTREYTSSAMRVNLELLNLQQNIGIIEDITGLPDNMCTKTMLINLYNHGVLCFYKNDIDELEYSAIIPKKWNIYGQISEVSTYPLFPMGKHDQRNLIVGENCVLLYDLPPLCASEKPFSRRTYNEALLDLENEVIGKLRRQIQLSGDRLLVTGADEVTAEGIGEEIEDLLNNDKAFSVLSSLFKIDTKQLSFSSTYVEIFNALKHLEEMRYYFNGIGGASFGSFEKNARQVTGEMNQLDTGEKIMYNNRMRAFSIFTKDLLRILGVKVNIVFVNIGVMEDDERPARSNEDNNKIQPGF